MELRKASKGQVKYLQSLKLKKNRLKYASFVAEGTKVIKDLVTDNNLNIKALYAFDSFFAEENEWLLSARFDQFTINSKELNQISSLRTPHQVVVECSIPRPVFSKLSNHILFLDQVADPGNLGTILRACDWFGISQLILSPDCADLFNPKTIQASKGSIGRVPYCILSSLEVATQVPQHTWYFADTSGESVHELNISEPFVLAVGSESHGLSKDTLQINGTKVCIPKGSDSTIDSLNVAMATTALLTCMSS